MRCAVKEVPPNDSPILPTAQAEHRTSGPQRRTGHKAVVAASAASVALALLAAGCQEDHAEWCTASGPTGGELTGSGPETAANSTGTLTSWSSSTSDDGVVLVDLTIEAETGDSVEASVRFPATFRVPEFIEGTLVEYQLLYGSQGVSWEPVNGRLALRPSQAEAPVLIVGSESIADVFGWQVEISEDTSTCYGREPEARCIKSVHPTETRFVAPSLDETTLAPWSSATLDGSSIQLGRSERRPRTPSVTCVDDLPPVEYAEYMIVREE